MSPTVTAWFSHFPFPGYAEYLHSEASAFEARHPGVTVDVRMIDYQKLPEVVAEAALRGEGPTLASYYSGGTPLALDTPRPDGGRWFGSLAEAVDGRGEVLGEEVVTDRLLPAVRTFYDGPTGLVAMPFTVTTKLMYASDRGRRAVDADGSPTWERLSEAAAQVAEDGGTLATWPVDGKFVQQAMTQLSTPLVVPDNGRGAPARRVCLDTGGLLRYLTWWQDLHRAGGYLHTRVPEDWAGTFAALVEGRAELRFSSSFDSKYMVEAGLRAGNPITVHPMPRPQGRPGGGAWVGGDGIFVARDLAPTARDAAVALTQFLARDEAMTGWHRSSGSIPVTTSAVTALEADGWYEEHPEHRAGVTQLAHDAGHPAASAPWVGDSDGIQRVLMKVIRTALDNDLGIELGLAHAQSEAQRLLDTYNRWRTTAGARPPASWRLSI